jgi:recombination associated protein RdgC
MLKNATLYRLSGALQSTETIEFDAAAAPFLPTSPTQLKSIGWVSPREKNGLRVEVVAGQIIMAAMIETRTVPASAVDKLVDAMAEKIEFDTGRKPGKKQRRELKNHAVFELLPKAFPKATRVLVWIDPAAGLAVLDTSSSSQSDDVAALMVRTLGLVLAPVVTTASPASIMGVWLQAGEADGGFALGSECQLIAQTEAKATVLYSNSDIDTDEVKGHVAGGKRAAKLGLCWLDRIDYVMTDGLVLKKINMALPTVGGSSDSFDADVAILTGELAPMLVDLISAMGGEFQQVEPA